MTREVNQKISRLGIQFIWLRASALGGKCVAFMPELGLNILLDALFASVASHTAFYNPRRHPTLWPCGVPLLSPSAAVA
jgi:hypothetical protein